MTWHPCTHHTTLGRRRDYIFMVLHFFGCCCPGLPDFPELYWLLLELGLLGVLPSPIQVPWARCGPRLGLQVLGAPRGTCRRGTNGTTGFLFVFERTCGGIACRKFPEFWGLPTERGKI